MLPFDRFVKAVDNWAASDSSDEYFAQIGGGVYEPKHMQFQRMLSPPSFAEKVASAKLIVAHAGMGSVIMAAEAGKPVILFPRRFVLGEHTTDHQLHTVDWLKDRLGIYVALDEQELYRRIPEAVSHVATGDTLPRTAPVQFVARVREALVKLMAE